MSDFVDRVTVHVKGGDGGNGSAGIRREKYKPLAGPNGGNGGDGGSVIFMADSNANSLLDYRFMPHREAESGTMGLGDTKDGSKATVVSAMRRWPIAPVVRRASHCWASRARNATSSSNSSPSPTWRWWAFRPQASRA